jgi:hypothetical protein
MHAVVGQVEITGQASEAQKVLDEFVVPNAKALAGFRGGTWARAVDAGTGHSLLLFDTEEAARAAAARIAEGPPAGAPVRFVSTTVCEVVAQA